MFANYIMTLAHNPQAFTNGYISMSRNMFLTSSVGISAIVFSNSFKKYDKVIKICALAILCFSMLYGYKSSKDFSKYLDYLEKHPDIDEPYNFLVKDWRGWVTMSYAYIAVIFVVTLFILFRKIK